MPRKPHAGEPGLWLWLWAVRAPRSHGGRWAAPGAGEPIPSEPRGVGCVGDSHGTQSRGALGAQTARVPVRGCFLELW